MRTLKRFAGVGLTLFLAGLLAACQGEKAPQGQATGLVVKGAGATFPAPLYAKWIEEYRRTRPAVTFSYDAVGSGEGVKRFLAGTVDFGASDAALSDKDLALVDPKRGAVMIPMAAGLVVLAYHIPGVPTGLILTRDAYLAIFAGRIHSWDDPRIAAANPGLKLPKADIVPVVRRDSSGTTFIMTNHLAAIDPWWAAPGPGVGKLVDWPDAMVTRATAALAGVR
jgi:phosphate transport system substrate-binding protein